ncbi:hypothetical protein SLEP1_g9716 [Rubroshorea leprosula]|uniref:Uncharacterized protein n=1 Tax=Rubroshorea leprosula TaxID=152421 RepID=A0AAV5IFP8_9ROSI|nr:hypothetical protein SLEP1_g9716 [Rubroshorea leprosula]
MCFCSFFFSPAPNKGAQPPTHLPLRNRKSRICSALFPPSAALALWV